MKSVNYCLALFFLFTLVFFTSCKSTKKLNTAKSDVETRNRSANGKKVVKSDTKLNANALVPMPPEQVKMAFRSQFPTVSSEIWSEKTPLIMKENSKDRLFKVAFEFNKKKNWLTFSENGQLIETKVEILPEHLPPYLVNSIKIKYPEARIISATTYKSVRKEGNYTANLITQPNSDEKQIVLLENGTFEE